MNAATAADKPICRGTSPGQLVMVADGVGAAEGCAGDRGSSSGPNHRPRRASAVAAAARKDQAYL